VSERSAALEAEERRRSVRRVRLLRFAIRLTVFSLAGLVVAGLVAYAAWHHLPYETLDRHEPDERFFFWEGVMWMLALAFTFFGLAALGNATDLYSRQGSAQELYVTRSDAHARRTMMEGIRGRTLFADVPYVPWAMLSLGLALALLAAIARARLG
jgi:hypothetical protein